MINLMSVPNRIRNHPPKVTIPMNKLIDNEAQLAAQGFQMVLDPHMRTPLEKLQNPSRSLKVGEIKSLLLDIADDYIDVLFPLFFWVSHCLACLLLAICP
ncbi:hypothetical protein PGTUg99_002172 [Puccinia graminis f. sp. tritici]|uniref:Uncharacterized protein n=1 Tax=Puccinia graminis f. sp. tritici TaxID=56615 RepID=A0A5B0S4W7_PUCGR|nr:hypothetical protein PGTUg99_002172 [Puccinia graminis f. sp. tritici]